MMHGQKNTCLVELYHSELYGKILLKSLVLLFTKAYCIIPYNRALFEKLIVVKIVILSYSLESEGPLPLQKRSAT